MVIHHYLAILFLAVSSSATSKPDAIVIRRLRMESLLTPSTLETENLCANFKYFITSPTAVLRVSLRLILRHVLGKALNQRLSRIFSISR